MQDSVVIIGMGEMGGVFARAFLKSGMPVYPVTRELSLEHAVYEYPTPECVLVAVGESDLQSVLTRLPGPWRERIVLLQNELLPRDWQPHKLTDPSIISVWFEKKKGQDVKVVVPSPVFGPKAELIQQVLANIEIPCTILGVQESLLFELVRKNLYILVTNICGLKTGGTVNQLWRQHEKFAREVASDILDIQEALTNQTLNREALIESMLVAFDGDPEHKCMGRSAPTRLRRAIANAEHAGLDVPVLKKVLGSEPNTF